MGVRGVNAEGYRSTEEFRWDGEGFKERSKEKFIEGKDGVWMEGWKGGISVIG